MCCDRCFISVIFLHLKDQGSAWEALESTSASDFLMASKKVLARQIVTNRHSYKGQKKRIKDKYVGCPRRVMEQTGCPKHHQDGVWRFLPKQHKQWRYFTSYLSNGFTVSCVYHRSIMKDGEVHDGCSSCMQVVCWVQSIDWYCDASMLSKWV